MKSTFSRSFYPFAMILLTALILVGVFFLQLASRFLERQSVQNLKSDCSAIAHVAGAYLEEDSLRDPDFLISLSMAAKVAEANAVICDENGILLVCSDSPLGCQHQGLCVTGEDFLDAVAEQDYVVSDGLIEGLYTDVRVSVATAIRNPATGQMGGVVLLSMPHSRAMLVLDVLTEHYLMVSVLVLKIRHFTSRFLSQ